MCANSADFSRDWIEAFYREHHRALAAYGASLTRSRDEAEDLALEATVVENPGEESKPFTKEAGGR